VKDKYLQEMADVQRETMQRMIDQLPSYSESFADHTSCRQTITSLRDMLKSQGRVSEQHREQVQKLAAEKAELAQEILKIGDVWDDEGYGDLFITLLNQVMRKAEKIVGATA
jgi:hypothetical protein